MTTESIDRSNTGVPYCDPKGLICTRHEVLADQCFRSRYGTSFVKSTAFDFGGIGFHCVHVIAIGLGTKKKIKLKVLVPGYLRFYE